MQSTQEDNAKKGGKVTAEVPCDGKVNEVKMLNDKVLDKKNKREMEKKEKEVKKQKEKELKNAKKLKSEKNIKIVKKTERSNPLLVSATCPEPVQVICPESQFEIIPVEKKSWMKCCPKKSKESKSKEKLVSEERTISKTSIKIEIAAPSTGSLAEKKPSETSQRSSKSLKMSKCAKSSKSVNTLIIQEEKFSQCEIFEFFPIQKPSINKIARGRGCAADCSKTPKRDSSLYERINGCQRPKSKMEICKPQKAPKEKKSKKEKKPSFSDEFTEKLKQGLKKIQKNALPFLKKKSHRTVKRMKEVYKNANRSRSKIEVNCCLRDCATEMSVCVSSIKQESTSSLASKNNCLKKSKPPIESSCSNKSLRLMEPYSTNKDMNKAPEKSQNLKSCRKKQTKKSDSSLKPMNTESRCSIKSESSKEFNLKKRRKRSSCCSRNDSPNNSKEDISYRPFSICECSGNVGLPTDPYDQYPMCCCPDGICENKNQSKNSKKSKRSNQEKSNRNHK
ncbi:uncharacterized protein LOC112493642 isoform X2 [Cephus cinctus]|uniref:Uncharacterized protein LOC112493642 isoform X2 n=1 Tax=Cephus cinctus TaxID=211228 RepID=A0AAJ7R795_CEPCN|nr:uncharacterized protein LOC112493642 isoform X2 [Cephus cinctus]